MILLIDLGKDQPAFAEHFEALLRLGGEKLAISEATAAGVTYRTFHLPQLAWPVAYGYAGDMLFITAGEDTPARLIAVMAAAAANLTGAGAFATAYAEVSGENEQWVLYADMPRVLGVLPGAPAEAAQSGPAAGPAEKLLEALGLDKVTQVVASTRVIDRGMYTRMRIAMPPAHRGLALLLEGPPLAAATDLAGAPADTQAVLACRFSIAAAWTQVRQVLLALGEHRSDRLDLSLAALDERLGLSLQDDVLANLSQPWMIVSAPSLGGMGTGTAFIATVKSPDKLREQLAYLRASFAPASQPSTRERERRGVPGAPSIVSQPAGRTMITYLQLPGAWSIAPACAVYENQLIGAGWPQVVQDLIERDANTSLAAQPALAAALHYVTDKPVLLAYLDTPRIAPLAYGWLLSHWTDVANRQSREGTFLRPGWLPSLSLLTRFITPSVLAVSVDDRGILIEDYGWIAAIPTAAAGVFAGDYMAPLLGESAGRPRSFGPVLEEFLSDLSRLPHRRPPASRPATAASQPH
jgi:hypothetical protein